MSILNNKLNNHILFLIDKSKNIINGDYLQIDEIWKYFINQKIDILKTENNNNDIININDEFHEFGFANLLFSICNNCEVFFIQLKINGKCLNCNNIINPKYEFIKCLIAINYNFLIFKSLDLLFLFLLPDNK